MRSGAPETRSQLETFKSRDRRLREGWFQRYCPPDQPGIDIGCSGDPVVDSFDQWDVTFGDGDAVRMEGLPAGTYHTVYTSHLLEHLTDPVSAVRRWFELVRPGGHLIICVPHRDLYEKRRLLPSIFNPDHKSFWLPDRCDPPHTLSLMQVLTDALVGQPFELRHLRVLDEGWKPAPPEIHSGGEYGIEAVVQRVGVEANPSGDTHFDASRLTGDLGRVPPAPRNTRFPEEVSGPRYRASLPSNAAERSVVVIPTQSDASCAMHEPIERQLASVAQLRSWFIPSHRAIDRSGVVPAPPPTLDLQQAALLLVLPDFIPSVEILLGALARGVPVLLPECSATILGSGALTYPETAGPSQIAATVERLLSDRALRNAATRRGWAQLRRPRNRGLLPQIAAAPKSWPVRPRTPRLGEPRQVSIVIACYGQRSLTEQCVSSLRADVPEAEILIVDNGSTDGTARWARGLGLRVIELGRNRGVPAAWNVGIEHASGDLIGVLNNDVIIHPGGMRALIAAAWSVGVSAFQGGTLDPQFHFLGFTEDAGRADYPDGCALLFRRDVWQEVGPFDEGMGLGYCEDSDWGLRARSKGYRWAIVPQALTHLGHQTAATVPQVRRQHELNNERMRVRWGSKGLGERIKVRRWGMLGDALMATPALAALRRERPLARIHFQCAPEIADLLREMPFVDVVDSEDYGDYTRVVDLDYATWDHECRGHWRHPTFAFADLLEVSIRPRSYWVPDVMELSRWATDLLPESGRRYIACGLRSEKRDKANWGEGEWRELTDAGSDYTFVLLDRLPQPPLEPRDEVYLGERLYDIPGVIDLTGKTPTLRHVLAILRRCSGCVAVDSGIFHLASAAGLPTVALMGGAPGWARQPLAGRHHILQGEADCYPCSDPWRCHRRDGGPHCLKWVSASRVISALDDVLR